MASFCLAVDRNFLGADGRRGCDFIDCVAWRGAAEFIGRNFFRGQQAVAEGRLTAETYIDRNGVKRKSVRLVVEEIHFAGGGTVKTVPYGSEVGKAPSGNAGFSGEAERKRDDVGIVPYGVPPAGNAEFSGKMELDCDFRPLTEDDGDVPF